MIREVIGPLAAWDVAAGSDVTLEPGAILYACRIRSHSHAETETGAEAYVMEFQSSGRPYSCPLFRFQPRTQAVDLVGHALACPDQPEDLPVEWDRAHHQPLHS